MKAAKRCPSLLARTVFCDVESVYHVFIGYNHLFGHRHIKLYSHSDDTFCTINKKLGVTTITFLVLRNVILSTLRTILAPFS